jgi:hypothetical protein
MSLIVEDGTGLATAESYVSVADADAYHLAMGNAGWTGTTTVKEAALRRATQYLDARYRFRGTAKTTTQALLWPRVASTSLYSGVIGAGLAPYPAVPEWPVKRLIDACCELALRAVAGPLYADQDAGRIQSETVGPISTTYFDQANGGQVRYSIVDDMLGPILAGGRSSLRLVRAA